jgi:hypothetical protein
MLMFSVQIAAMIYLSRVDVELETSSAVGPRTTWAVLKAHTNVKLKL